MRKKTANLGDGGVAFPNAKPSNALRAEDAFMRDHSGFGSRVIYLIAEALTSSPQRKNRRVPSLRDRLVQKKYGVKHLL